MLDVKLLLFIIAGFFWGGLTAPVSIRLAGMYGILDIPDARKIHKVNTPRGAGLGIWGGYLLMAVMMAGEIPSLKFIATGATMIFLCGYLDDMCSLSPFLRLGLHMIAASLVILPLNLDIFVSALAIIWIAGVTSAYNLIDGMNGLCISLFIASSIALFFLGKSYAGLFTGAMALGVLCWNFPSAQTFLGDGGSTLLGYLFASHLLTIILPRMRGESLGKLIVLFVLFGGIPFIDTMVAFTRRMLTGHSPFYPDKKHLHHILMMFTNSNVVTVTIMLSLHLFSLAAGLRVFSGMP